MSVEFSQPPPHTRLTSCTRTHSFHRRHALSPRIPGAIRSKYSQFCLWPHTWQAFLFPSPVSSLCFISSGLLLVLSSDAVSLHSSTLVSRSHGLPRQLYSCVPCPKHAYKAMSFAPFTSQMRVQNQSWDCALVLAGTSGPPVKSIFSTQLSTGLITLLYRPMFRIDIGLQVPVCHDPLKTQSSMNATCGVESQPEKQHSMI